MKPFIKWAGGKTQLLPEIRAKYSIIDEGITKYCEPFIGGGAVLFDILKHYKFDEICINDINTDLTNTYKQIKCNSLDLIQRLYTIQNEYWDLEQELRKEYYYEKRERFNSITVGNSQNLDLEMASLFIFLNKTCFNGLFRVNKKGEFNVPIGSYKKPLICDEENLKLVSQVLQNVSITTGDYKLCLEFIDQNTFVYIDPPYRPISETASFTSYAKTDFNDNDQIALSEFVTNITQKGAKVVISNSDPKNNNADDNFFDDIYSNYTIERVIAKRMINSDSKNRGDINELLINNF